MNGHHHQTMAPLLLRLINCLPNLSRCLTTQKNNSRRSSQPALVNQADAGSWGPISREPEVDACRSETRLACTSRSHFLVLAHHSLLCCACICCYANHLHGRTGRTALACWRDEQTPHGWMDGMDCRRGSVRPTWGVVRWANGVSLRSALSRLRAG